MSSLRLLRTHVSLALIAALLLVSVASFVPSPAAASEGSLSAAKQLQAVSSAVAWIAARQQSDGGFSSGFAPGSSAGATADAVLGLAAANADPGMLRKNGLSALEYLATQASTYSQSAGGAAKLVLALVAAGRDPRDFAGLDLLSTLAGYAGASGQYTHSPYDGTVAQALSILALKATFSSVPASATSWLRSQQNADGGWGYASGSASDTNSTALALQALAAAGEPITSPAVVAGKAYLASTQRGDGGFPYNLDTSYGEPASDANSTAYVIQALLAIGENPLSSTWHKGDKTPLDALLSLQLASGAFEYQPGFGENYLATFQALPAIMGKPFPIRGRLEAARQALAWLRNQQQGDGGFGSGFAPGSSAGATADAVLGLAVADEDPASWRSAAGFSPLDYLASQAITYTAAGAGQAGKLILAVKAAGGSAANFGGANLVGTLRGFLRPDGQYKGSEGDGAVAQAFAILGLRAVAETVPVSATSWLRSQQNADGGWGYASGSASDTNSTALALQALTVSGEPVTSTLVTRALAYLASAQRGDGGFPYNLDTTYGEPASDANSTAYAIQGIVASVSSAQAEAWTRSLTGTIALRTPVDDLLALQNASGAFAYQAGGADNNLATYQALPALFFRPFPLYLRPPLPPSAFLCPLWRAPSKAAASSVQGRVYYCRAPGSTGFE